MGVARLAFDQCHLPGMSQARHSGAAQAHHPDQPYRKHGRGTADHRHPDQQQAKLAVVGGRDEQSGFDILYLACNGQQPVQVLGSELGRAIDYANVVS